MKRRRIALGTGSVGLMVALLVIYVVLHSPLRQLIWEPLFGECDFYCAVPSIWSAGFQALTSLWLVFLAGAGAAPVARRAVPGSLERVVAWGLISYGLLVMPSAAVAFLGDRVGLALLRPPVGPVLASIPALVCLAWGLRSGWRPHLPRSYAMPRATLVLVVLALLVAAGQAVQVGLAAQYPPAGFDDLGYHAPLAVLFWRDGSLETFLARIVDTPVLNHPGGVELWQGLLLMIGGEPLAKGGQVPFAWLGAAGVALFATRLGLGRGAAFLAGLLFLLAPIVMEQVSHMRNDVAAAALVATTAALLAARRDDATPARVMLAGLGIGLMAVTKLALLPAIAAAGILLLYVVIRESRQRDGMRSLWIALGVAVVLAGLAVAPWWLRNLALEGNPLFPANLPLIGGGIPWTSPADTAYVPDRLLWPLYPLLETYGVADGFGGALAVGILPGVLAAVWIARRRPLLVVAVLLLTTLPAWWLLDRREPRFLLGIVALVFAIIPFGLVALKGRWRQAGIAILATAAIATAAAQMAVTNRPANVERTSFYDRTWGVAPVAVTLNEREGILLDDRCEGAGINRLYPFMGAGGERAVGRLDCEGVTTETIERTLRKHGLSHVYVFVPSADEAARAALYPADRFELVDRTTMELARRSGTFARLLYRWLGPDG